MDLKDLYRDVIVDHNRNPRNFREHARCRSHAPRVSIPCAATG